jgi:hypothetical protein
VHEIRTEIQIRLRLVVGAAAQFDVCHFVRSALGERIPVMKFDEASRAAAFAEVIDKDAPATVAQPDLASYRGWDRAWSARGLVGIGGRLICAGRRSPAP